MQGEVAAGEALRRQQVEAEAAAVVGALLRLPVEAAAGVRQRRLRVEAVARLVRRRRCRWPP